MSFQGCSISSLDDLVEASQQDNSEFAKAVWYRGITEKEHKLVPLVFRRTSRMDEATIANRFRVHGASRIDRPPAQEDWVGWLTLMRHHGLPTRLLDWTPALLIAAIFAVDREKSVQGDAFIWALRPGLLSVKHGQKAGASVLSSDNELLRAAFGERGRTEPGVAQAVVAAENSNRMMVQKSSFTIHSDGTPLEELSEASQFLRKHTIPHAHVKDLRASIEALGMDRRYLFPDIDGLAQALILEWEEGVNPEP